MANSVTKFLKLVGGKAAEVFAVITSTGADDADKIPALNDKGVLDKSILNGVTASAGAADAGKTPILGADGKLSPTLFNATGNSNSRVMSASEALSAGNWINVHNVGGASKVRKADASTEGKHCMGYVLEGVASGGNVTVYFEGENTGVTGQTPGDVFLSKTTPGAGQATSPTGAGVISQRVGIATSDTSVNYQPGMVTVQVS